MVATSANMWELKLKFQMITDGSFDHEAVQTSTLRVTYMFFPSPLEGQDISSRTFVTLERPIGFLHTRFEFTIKQSAEKTSPLTTSGEGRD